jgi:hypothetical protein
MLTRLTYVVDPESLGDIPQDDFVDELQHELRKSHTYGYSEICIKFRPCASNYVESIEVLGNLKQHTEAVKEFAEFVFKMLTEAE